MLSSMMANLLNWPVVRPWARYLLVCPKSPPPPVRSPFPSPPVHFSVSPLRENPITVTTSRSHWDFLYSIAVDCLTAFFLAYMVDLILQWIYGQMISKKELELTPAQESPIGGSSSPESRSILSSTTSIVSHTPVRMNQPRIIDQYDLSEERKPAGDEVLGSLHSYGNSRESIFMADRMNDTFNETIKAIVIKKANQLTGIFKLKQDGLVEFVYMDEAKEVKLFGSFCKFPILMEPSADFKFSTVVPLLKGFYSYEFRPSNGI